MMTYRIEYSTDADANPRSSRAGLWVEAPGEATEWDRTDGERAACAFLVSDEDAQAVRLVDEMTGEVAWSVTRTEHVLSKAAADLRRDHGAGGVVAGALLSRSDDWQATLARGLRIELGREATDEELAELIEIADEAARAARRAV